MKQNLCMKQNQVEGIVHDVLYYMSYENPLNHVFAKHKFEINLINGSVDYPQEDSISDFYRKKREWFAKRVARLKGRLGNFKKAKINVYGAKEKVEINYRGKKFAKEFTYDSFGQEIRKLKEEIKKLEPFEVRY